MMNRPVMLVILDGFGLAAAGPGNAVALADTPHFDSYWASYPHTELSASGEAVGLPKGQMGNSEVGHLNIGAGRIVMQSLSFIQNQIDSGEITKNPVLNDLFAKSERVHFMGLLGDGGVHSDSQHLYGLLEFAKKSQKPCFVHVFTDGRDTAPDSGLGFVQALQGFIAGLAAPIDIASVTGRYYAMDRDKRWERVKQAYDAIVCAKAEFQASSAEEAIRQAYARGETDEFIKATVISKEGKPKASIEDGDGVFFFNFRADRARQLSHALLADDSWAEFARCKLARIHFASLMQYDKALAAPYALELPPLNLPLAEVISNAGKKQYHTAETEKYPHVTFFFNAQREIAFPGETRQIIPSPQEVPTYDYKPEMSAPELTQATLARLRDYDDDFILINFANPDMVGHTGVIEAAKKACEAADAGLGQLVSAMREKRGSVIIIADHGNAEKMLTEEGKPHTAHTTNPVPCIVITDRPGFKLRQGGVLADVAPTVLELMGLEQPEEMTGKSLLKPQ